MRQCIVFIESNTTGTGRMFAQTARSLGFEPVMVAEDASRYPYIQLDAVEFVQQPCIRDLKAVDRSIRELSQKYQVRGIYSSSEYFIESAAELARRLGVHGPDPVAVRVCRNKWLQRQRLKEAGVPVPAFFLARSIQEALESLEAMALPVVMKPVTGSGSVGVRLCRTQTELEIHAEGLLSNDVNERGMPVPREVIIEEYFSSPEYSAETFGLTLLGITRKHVSPEPYFVETGHDFPVTLPGGVAEEAIENVKCALRAVGMDWGPAHTEFRCDQAGCVIMEINPRLAGGFIPEMIRMARGIDVVRETVSVVAGEEPHLVSTRDWYASIRFLCPEIEGRIVGFRGLVEASAVEGVASVQAYRKAGDEFLIRHDFRDRIGHVLASSQQEQATMQAAETARKLIGIEIERDTTRVGSDVQIAEETQRTH